MQLDEDTQSWLTQRNMSRSKRITLQAFSRTDWLTFFLKIWFQEYTHTHTHTHTHNQIVTLFHEMTQQQDGQFRHNTRQVCLPCIACSSYTFLTIILTNIFVFTKIQTLSYKCCRPSGQRTTIPSIYIGLQTWMPRIHIQNGLYATDL